MLLLIGQISGPHPGHIILEIVHLHNCILLIRYLSLELRGRAFLGFQLLGVEEAIAFELADQQVEERGQV